MSSHGGFTDSLQGVVQGLGSQDIFGIFDLPVFAKLYFFLRVAFFMAVVMFGAILFYKYYLQFNKKMIIKKKFGEGGEEIIYDTAKVVTDEQGKTKLQLFRLKKGKKRVTCPVPADKYKKKLGKRDLYEMWLDDNYELHPIERSVAEENIHMLRIRPEERAAWSRMESKILRDKYEKKDVLLKYATPAIMMTAMITVFLIFFFASKEIGSGLSELAATFKQIASSCTQLG